MRDTLGRLGAYLGAFLGPFFFIYPAHLLGKLPDEPFWAGPIAVYENIVFAASFGLGLPYAEYTTPFFILFLGFLGFVTGRFFGRLIGRLFPQPKA